MVNLRRCSRTFPNRSAWGLPLQYSMFGLQAVQRTSKKEEKRPRIARENRK